MARASKRNLGSRIMAAEEGLGQGAGPCNREPSSSDSWESRRGWAGLPCCYREAGDHGDLHAVAREMASHRGNLCLCSQHGAEVRAEEERSMNV